MRVLTDSLLKFICIFFLISCTVTSYSQKRDKHLVDGVLYIDSVSDNGILLDRGWRMKTGDNYSWANIEFDDSNWSQLTPIVPIAQYLNKYGQDISWFRIKINIDSSLSNIAIALRIQQNAASEIYIDGKLVQKYGIVSGYADSLKTYNPLYQPLFIDFEKRKFHVIAVRIVPTAYLTKAEYFEIKNQLFKCFLCNANSSTQDVYSGHTIGFGLSNLIIGIFGILSILHFGFFFNYTQQKANLFLGVFCLLTGLSYFFYNVLVYEIHDVELSNLIKPSASSLATISLWFLLEALYSLLAVKRGIFYRFILILLIISFVMILAQIGSFEFRAQIVMIYFPFLIVIDAVRLSIISKLRKVKSTQIIIAGVIVFFVFAIVTALNFIELSPFENIDTYSSLAMNINYNASILSIPFSVSIFLIFEFGFTRKQLLKEQAAKVRIAQDLHDDLGSQLSAAHIFLNAYKNDSNGYDKEQLLSNSISLLESSIKDLRHIMNNIQHSTLLEKGYIAATEELVNRIKHLQHINFKLSHHDVKGRFDYKIENNLFRVTQELINNTLKYAEAKNISIELLERDNDIIFMYEDDGKGCALEAITRGYGLNNIKTRIESIRGLADFDTIPGNGFRCTIEIPIIYV